MYLTCSLVGLVYFCRVKTLDRTYNEFMLLKVVCFVHHCQKSQDDSHEYAFLIIQDWTFLYKHSRQDKGTRGTWNPSEGSFAVVAKKGPRQLQSFF